MMIEDRLQCVNQLTFVQRCLSCTMICAARLELGRAYTQALVESVQFRVSYVWFWRHLGFLST